jgi:tRNA G46 methylase TrmB
LADRVLVSTGKILVVTDDDSYAEHVRERLAKVSTFSESEFTGDVTLTSYHQRALRLQHKIHAIEIVRVTN